MTTPPWKDGLAVAEALVETSHQKLNDLWNHQSHRDSDPAELRGLEIRAIQQGVSTLQAIAMLRDAGCPWDEELDFLWWTGVRFLRKSLEASALAKRENLLAVIDSFHDTGDHHPPRDMFRYFDPTTRTLPSEDVHRILDEAFQKDLADTLAARPAPAS